LLYPLQPGGGVTAGIFPRANWPLDSQLGSQLQSCPCIQLLCSFSLIRTPLNGYNAFGA
ncbi:hypothetical protein CRENBAI_021411, partial [Crenichthys baileyi]